ncbi:MAG: AAA family ATPase [Proteobacteria bacterium]|nr:AAA family ATPase [Pseudomonadota bacterium]
MERVGKPGTDGSGTKTGKDRVWVEDAGVRRPFMRGILIHSLMSRGISYESAERAANAVRSQIGKGGTVSRNEIAKLVLEEVGSDVYGEVAPAAPALLQGISVQGHGTALPFSKGALSQSLLAAAIEPNDAFDVAREIELELVRQGVRHVDRRDVRRLAYDALKQRFGPKTADRYLAWRWHQDPDRPVFLLLGGAAGVGKTSLAVEVAHRLGISRVLSTDSIRQVMRLTLSPDLSPTIHASSFDAYRRLSSAMEGDDPVIDGFMTQASVVSVGVRAILDRAVAETTSLVLDGVSIVPGIVDLKRYRDVAHVIPLVVATLETDAFQQRFATRGTHQERRGTHRYVENVENILKIQEHFLELAERYNVPIVDNASFDATVLLVVRHVVEALRREEEFDASELLARS